MVGFLWQGICPSIGIYLYKTTQTQTECRHTSVPWLESKPQPRHLVCSSHTSHSTIKVFSTPVTSYSNYTTDGQNTPSTVMHSHINSKLPSPQNWKDNQCKLTQACNNRLSLFGFINPTNKKKFLYVPKEQRILTMLSFSPGNISTLHYSFWHFHSETVNVSVTLNGVHTWWFVGCAEHDIWESKWYSLIVLEVYVAL